MAGYFATRGGEDEMVSIEEAERSVFQMTRREAWKKNVCIDCKETISIANIYSAAGAKEYNISAMCEMCFDKIAR